jgi:hypothetical protein
LQHLDPLDRGAGKTLPDLVAELLGEAVKGGLLHHGLLKML